MSLYLEKFSNKVYFKDLIVLIDKNASPYCVFTTSDNFSVGDEIILYINSSEYLRFKVYRIKEFKEMNRPIYYKIIALHRSDWVWKNTLNSDGFEIGVQKDWNDGSRTVKLFVSSLDAMNLSLLGIKTSTPTTIPANAPTLSEDLKCDGNTDALTTKMGTTEPYTIIFKDDNNAQLIYDSQITSELDVSDWIPFEEYEKWTDPSGTSYQSRVKYYIKEGHFTTFYYAGEKYNDGTDSGTINTLMFHREKTEVYDTYNPQISRVQITGTSASHEGRKFGDGSYSSLDFTDDISCVTFKKFISSWSPGESNKVSANFLVPEYLAKDTSGNNLKANYITFRIRTGTTFPGSEPSEGTFYVKVYKNGVYQETLEIKAYEESITLRPEADGDVDFSTVYPSSPSTHYDKVDEETADDDTTYVEQDYTTTRKYETFTNSWIPPSSLQEEANLRKIKMYARVRTTNGNNNFYFYCVTAGTNSHGAVYSYLDFSEEFAKTDWSIFPSSKFGVYVEVINSGNTMRFTQIYWDVIYKYNATKKYSLTYNDLYTFEFYHNESSALSNINIIGSLTDFEVIT